MSESKYNDKPRLENPYIYFAYLSNTVFIGGKKIDDYSFDTAKVAAAVERDRYHVAEPGW